MKIDIPKKYDINGSDKRLLIKLLYDASFQTGEQILWPIYENNTNCEPQFFFEALSIEKIVLFLNKFPEIEDKFERKAKIKNIEPVNYIINILEKLEEEKYIISYLGKNGKKEYLFDLETLVKNAKLAKNPIIYEG